MHAKKLPEHSSLAVAPVLSYRVTFFRRLTAENALYTAESWSLSDTRDIHEVLIWADQHAANSNSVAIYAEVDDGAGETILILLGGDDPTKGDPVTLTAHMPGT